MNDLELLRTYEPEMRFTAGELFLPCAVDEYVKQCSLWSRDAEGKSNVIVPAGALDLDHFVDRGAEDEGQGLYLRYVDRPLTPREYQRWLTRSDRFVFRAPGRLARVPPLSRLIDSAFDLALLLRGRVPGGTAAAAQIKYTDLLTRDDRRVYYGRVVRAGSWTVLHYLFFYVMNDWRSSFHGANDHEADWEQIFVYLYESEDGELVPRWVAFASHDDYGDDLRRRWDDPLLIKTDTHPVIFAAAGSHASYFEQGEYLMGVEPGFLRPVRRIARALRGFWVERLGQGRKEVVNRKAVSKVAVPFVDYARGDGMAIGPGGNAEWTPIVISDEIPWVSKFRGLWGLDTRDRFGGERAPAGPKFNRDGSVRLSWYDPLGWSGLDKVLPPVELSPSLHARERDLAREIADLDRQIAESAQVVQTLSLDMEAVRAMSASSELSSQAADEMRKAETDLRALKALKNATAETLQAVELYAQRVRNGVTDEPRAHLHHIQRPDPAPEPRRLLQVWAALSGAMSLFAVMALLLFLPAHWWLWSVMLILSFGTVEAAAEGRLLDFLLNVAVVLAAISGAILVWEFWRLLIVLILGVVISLMVRDNLRELRTKSQHRRA